MVIEHADTATAKPLKIIVAVLALLGLSAPALLAGLIGGWRATLPLYRWAVLLLPIGFVIVWICGMMWERASGPEIRMRDLRYDPHKSFYFVTITNCNRHLVKPRLRLLSVEYLDGQKTELFTHSRSIRPTLHQELVMKGEHFDATVLANMTKLDDPTRSALGAWAMADPKDPTPIVPATTRDNRKAIYIRIGADCGEGSNGNSIDNGFVLRPRAGTDEYTIDRVKRRPRA
jgi:hypothetical protein